VQGSHIDGVQPYFETIADGSYSIARPLFVYINKAHLSKVPGLQEFIEEIVSEKAIGEMGYLSFKGLIPLPEEDLALIQKSVKEGKTL